MMRGLRFDGMLIFRLRVRLGRLGSRRRFRRFCIGSWKKKHGWNFINVDLKRSSIINLRTFNISRFCTFSENCLKSWSRFSGHSLLQSNFFNLNQVRYGLFLHAFSIFYWTSSICLSQRNWFLLDDCLLFCDNNLSRAVQDFHFDILTN